MVYFDPDAWRRNFYGAKNDENWQYCRNLLIEIFNQTLAIVKDGGYMSGGTRVPISSSGMTSAFYRSPDALPDGGERYNTEYSVIDSDSLNAAEALVKQGVYPCVLNMASRRNPGGGVINGSGAQEENIFRRTNLFVSMYAFAEYAWQYERYGVKPSPNQYPLDWLSGGVYSGGVTVFRGDEASGYPLLAEPYKVAVVSVPAINCPHMTLRDGEPYIVDDEVPRARSKIRSILRISALHGHDSLVLGAWGCGAFHNPPRHIATLFKETFAEAEFAGRFKRVVFAIINRKGWELENLRQFEEVFR
ncbi:MAG: TIGR02452 family protein [Synergistaceae bacterium]|jgi:uncharacterized protein (TIGR02452 family)|nr:TIGR02452 family protein [Synergistaceae bacterium]